jgi:hypothetical protein
MSSERVIMAFAVIGLVLSAALAAGCLGDGEQPAGRVSATEPPVPETGGVSGGTVPAPQETTLPLPIPIGS